MSAVLRLLLCLPWLLASPPSLAGVSGPPEALAGTASSAGPQDEPLVPAEDVVLLHGLARSARNMSELERGLTAAGYRTHNLDYPSTEHPPEALVAYVGEEIDRCCAEAETIHFVTHSMGGILLRAYLAEHPLDRLGRVVMLAPPNHGSEYVDVAGDWAVFGRWLGPTALQLGTGPESLPNRLPPPGFDLGVIAGTGSINPLGDLVIAGENDGTVSVESARVEGMRDFLEVDVSHTFIVSNAEVMRQAIAYLRSGAFAREP